MNIISTGTLDNNSPIKVLIVNLDTSSKSPPQGLFSADFVSYLVNSVAKAKEHLAKNKDLNSAERPEVVIVRACQKIGLGS